MLFFILLYKVLDWYADVWIITDHGMVDVRWSIFINDMTFTEFDDISSVQYGQRSLFDKLFDIGDVTIHKMGDEMYISRMHHPSKIADIIQSNIHTHHHEEHKAASDTHIYLDGVRQNHTSVPYKSGFRYMPAADDEKFVEEMRKQPGVIDLSGKPKVEEKKIGKDSHGHGHHGH